MEMVHRKGIVVQGLETNIGLLRVRAKIVRANLAILILMFHLQAL